MPGVAPTHAAPDPLSVEDAEILMTLWRNSHEDITPGTHRRGLTRDELTKSLVVAKTKPFPTKSALLKHLNKFSSPVFSDIIRIEKVRPKKPNRKSEAGSDCFSYSLAAGSVITWPCTARIVLTVWDARGGHIFEEALLAKIEPLRLRNDPNEPAMDRAAILNDIDRFAIPLGYLDRYGPHLRADTPELTRLRFELEYISEVAWQCFVGDPSVLQLKPKS